METIKYSDWLKLQTIRCNKGKPYVMKVMKCTVCGKIKKN